MTYYDDAELMAIQVVKECARENYATEGRSKEIPDLVMQFYRQHGSNGMHALVIALGRLAATSWTAALHDRLGHFPSEDEMLAELDSFEMHKIDQHQYEQDNPEDVGDLPDRAPRWPRPVGVSVLKFERPICR